MPYGRRRCVHSQEIIFKLIALFNHSMKRKLLSILLLLLFLIGALLVGNWEYKFFPRNRVEIVHPTSKNRAFTHVYGFVDTSIPLSAADWPRTFANPVMLGDVFAEGYPVYHVHWSNDGSVLALRIKSNSEDEWLFTSAYDFNQHLLIHESKFASLNDSNARIRQLLEERGGMAPVLTGIDDGKLVEYKAGFPAWGWFPPLLIAAIGLFAAGKIWRGPAVRKALS